MNAPEAEQQIVSGVYALEDSKFRWTSKTAILLLKPPAEAVPLVVRFYIPDQAPARQVTVQLNNQVVATQNYPRPGSYTLVSEAAKPDGASAQVTISVDKTFSTQADKRELGFVLISAGFEHP